MTTATSDELNALFVELGFDCDPPNDERIYLPSQEWLSEFGTFLFRKKPFYRIQSFDCDNFSAWCVVLASEALYNSGFKDADHSVVRLIFTLRETVLGIKPGRHAANAVWLENRDLVLFEPQNGEFTSLAPLVASGALVPDRMRW